MKFIDMHCDTIWKIQQSHGISTLYQNDFQVDIKKLQKSNSIAQFFALFVDTNSEIRKGIRPWDDFIAKYEIMEKQLELFSYDIRLAKNNSDLEKNIADNKISAFLTIEEGGILEGQINRLQKVYDMGVRLITLTWNYPNSIGFPNSLSKEEYPNQNLTEFGREVIQKMNELGMIIDVSHLSDDGFYDVHKLSKKPYVASHSNARALMNHGRNMTDDMLKTLGDDGGIVGLNFHPPFLNKEHNSTVDALVSHIKHMADKAGIDAIAIGTDFDGIEGYQEVKDIGQMDKLFNALEKIYSYDEIEKIWYKNTQRIIKEVMK